MSDMTNVTNKGLFSNWTWDDTAGSIFAAFVIGLIIVLFMWIFADKEIKCYYPMQVVDSSLFTIYSDIAWDEDVVAFKTTDYNQYVELLNTLKLCGDES